MSASEIGSLIISAIALLLGLFNFQHQRRESARLLSVIAIGDGIDDASLEIRDPPFVVIATNIGNRETRIVDGYMYLLEGPLIPMELDPEFYEVLPPSDSRDWQPTPLQIDAIERENRSVVIGVALKDVSGTEFCTNVLRYDGYYYRVEKKRQFRVWLAGMKSVLPSHRGGKAGLRMRAAYLMAKKEADADLASGGTQKTLTHEDLLRLQESDSEAEENVKDSGA